MSALPCGRAEADLVRLVTEDDDAELAEHAAGCPFCAVEADALRERWRLVRRAAVTPVPTPPGLVDRVLGAVRGGPPVVLDQEGGRLTVSGRAVLAVSRRLAVDLAEGFDLRVRGAAVEDDGRLQVLVAARYGTAAVEAADALRSRLADELVARLGPAAPVVDVHLIDIE
ncbi:hypothetical protein [Saccharothrix xinjiangensis]|uniref:Asp23/Gls24 family envelope stress response protein n=1 Tax=Saccharothrix xinjiangensis TaxID=204798 RepID=A0ABV9XZD0_9PSEU